jgi:hypothetical protein
MTRNSPVKSGRSHTGAGDEREPDDKSDRKVGGGKPTPGEPDAGKLARRVRRRGWGDDPNWHRALPLSYSYQVIVTPQI